MSLPCQTARPVSLRAPAATPRQRGVRGSARHAEGPRPPPGGWKTAAHGPSSMNTPMSARVKCSSHDYSPWSSLRLRAPDPARAEAVERGLAMMLDAVGGPGDPVAQPVDDLTTIRGRMRQHLSRLLESYERCGYEAWAHTYSARRDDGRKGQATVWHSGDCAARGHEDCSARHQAHAAERHAPALRIAYGFGTVRVINLVAPGWGLKAARDAAQKTLDSTAVKAAVGPVQGYMSAFGGERPGYGCAVVVPGRVGDREIAAILREWRRRVPCGWVYGDDLPWENATAEEAVVEVAVRSEQSVALLLAVGKVDTATAVKWYAHEIGADQCKAQSPGARRQVVSAELQVLRRLAKALEAEVEVLDQAEVAPTLAAEPVCPADHEAVDSPGSMSAFTLYEAYDPHEVNRGTDAATASGTGPSGSAGYQSERPLALTTADCPAAATADPPSETTADRPPIAAPDRPHLSTADGHGVTLHGRTGLTTWYRALRDRQTCIHEHLYAANGRCVGWVVWE